MLDLIAQITIQRPSPLPNVGATQDTLNNVLMFAFGILGGISLIMITLQGLRYAYSSGDPGKTAQAKNGIIYALIGVVVALTGVSLTQFALGEVLPTATGEGALIGTDSVLVRAASFIALITGITSVIMIIIGGVKYNLASGDPSKVASARNTIIYALVGAVVAAVAGPIVIFAVQALTGAGVQT